MSERNASRWHSLRGRGPRRGLPSGDVVAALGALGASDRLPSPSADFRADLRAQLVAITSRVVAEPGILGGLPGRATEPATKPAGERAGAAPRWHVKRLAVTGAAVIAAFAVMLGTLVVLSSRALPGDALYGLKRATESVQLAFTSGTDRGRKYLQFATTRAEESNDLISRSEALASGSGVQAAGISDRVSSLIVSTLKSADSDVDDASTVLIDQASRERKPGPLEYLIDWAPGQIARLTAIADRLPDGPAKAQALHSLEVTRSAQELAIRLAAQSPTATPPVTVPSSSTSAAVPSTAPATTPATSGGTAGGTGTGGGGGGLVLPNPSTSTSAQTPDTVTPTTSTPSTSTPSAPTPSTGTSTSPGPVESTQPTPPPTTPTHPTPPPTLPTFPTLPSLPTLPPHPTNPRPSIHPPNSATRVPPPILRLASSTQFGAALGAGL